MTTAVIAAGTSRDPRLRALATETLRLSGQGLLIDLDQLDAAALLGRGAHPSLDAAIATVLDTPVVALCTVAGHGRIDSTLALFLERLPPAAFLDRPVVLGAVGDERSYFAIDSTLRAQVADLGGWVAGGLTYVSTAAASPAGFSGDRLDDLRRQEIAGNLTTARHLRLAGAAERWA